MREYFLLPLLRMAFFNSKSFTKSSGSPGLIPGTAFETRQVSLKVFGHRNNTSFLHLVN
jgi:hypothetical protein